MSPDRSRRAVVCLAVVLASGLLAGQAALAGPFAGVEADSPRPSTRSADLTATDGSAGWYEKFLGEGSPYRGLVFGVVTLVVLLVAYRLSTRKIRGYLRERAFKADNARKFLRTWKALWTFGILVFFLIAFSGSLSVLGISAGFLGMILGWSLQAPVTGLAAWLMIVVKKPFRIGDRIVIGGTVGDVTDITLTHVVLNQVGGSVSGEEKSGRGVLVPNAILFSQTITNYTLEQKFMLDEVPVRVTFDSDVELAEQLLLEAARQTVADVIDQTGEQPFLRMEFYDAGVLMRLRYLTIPAERQKISSGVVRAVLSAFKDNYPAVKFGYPHSVVRYQADDPAGPPALRGRGGEGSVQA
jgi:small-conductance mechanosensitive channel